MARKSKSWFDRWLSRTQDHPEREEVGRVRKVDFPEGMQEHSSRFKLSKSRKERVMAPSGTLHSFRQKGGSTKSQYITLQSEEDANFYEQKDGYEVERFNPRGE